MFILTNNWYYSTTNISIEQPSGLAIRYPFLRSLYSLAGSMPGYGEPPNVTISHSNTPYDQLGEIGEVT